MTLFLFTLSFLIGFLLMDCLFLKAKRPDFLIHLILSIGLGMGLSGELTFYSLCALNRFWGNLLLIAHIVLFCFLLALKLYWDRKYRRSFLFAKDFCLKDAGLLAVLLLCLVPVIIYGRFHPFGGWDAWTIWNLKSKFIFGAGTQWKNVFNPLLHHSRPHYPFLLSLINLWGWAANQTPTFFAPFLTSIVLTLSTGILLFAALRIFIRRSLALLAALILLVYQAFVQSGTSQYSDILIAYLLLASVFCLFYGRLTDNLRFIFLGGLFMGLLSFSKNEGIAAAFILIFIDILVIVFLSIKQKQRWPKEMLAPLLFGFAVCALPTVIFKIWLSPGDQLFTNGLHSSLHPSDWTRLKTIIAFFFAELVSPKWGKLWFLLFLGLVLSKGKCFERKVIIFPLFIVLYLCAVFAYYFINTHWEILWWLQTSLSRILFTLLPISVFWVFYSLFAHDKLYQRKKDELPQ